MSNNNDNEQLSNGDKSLIGLYMISRLRNGGGAEEVEKGAEQIKNILKSQKQIYGMSSGDIFENIFRPSNNINNINEAHNIQNNQNNTVQNGEEGDKKKKKKKKHRRKKKNKDNIKIQEDKKEENNGLNKNVSGIDTTTNGNTKQRIDNNIYDDDFEEFQEEDKKEEDFKNVIKTEIHEEKKDEVVEEFKKDITEDTRNSDECEKKKLDDPIREKIIEMCEKYNKQDKKIKSLDDTNGKNNNIEK